MMRCEELVGIVNEYLDGELDAETTARLDRHLVACSSCRLLIDNLRHTLALFAHGRPVDVPPDACKHLKTLLRDRWKEKFPGRDPDA